MSDSCRRRYPAREAVHSTSLGVSGTSSSPIITPTRIHSSLPVLQFRQSRVYFIICNHYYNHNQIWHVRVATTNFSLFCNIDSSFQKYLPHPGSIFSKYLKLKYWIWHCSFNNWRNFLLQQFWNFDIWPKGTVG